MAMSLVIVSSVTPGAGGGSMQLNVAWSYDTKAQWRTNAWTSKDASALRPSADPETAERQMLTPQEGKQFSVSPGRVSMPRWADLGEPASKGAGLRWSARVVAEVHQVSGGSRDE